MPADGPLVVALFGPTGVGKTAVGVEVGHRLGVRVISCDALQLYPDLPVLTNQPVAAELQGVAHVLVGDEADGCEWTAARYAERARSLIDEDVALNGTALLVGGTGLYMRAALAPLAAAPPADPRLRAGLEERARLEGGESLHRELAELDPAAAEAIHPRNVRRVVRALEVVRTGSVRGWSGRSDLWRPAYRHPTLLVGLVMDRRILSERIDARARSMVAGGAVDEVRRYRERMQRHPTPRGVEKAIGFRELAAYLDGACTLDQAELALAAATRKYARRQLTWMRRLEDAVIIDVSARRPEEVADEVVKLAGARRSGDPQGGEG